MTNEEVAHPTDIEELDKVSVEEISSPRLSQIMDFLDPQDCFTITKIFEIDKPFLRNDFYSKNNQAKQK